MSGTVAVWNQRESRLIDLLVRGELPSRALRRLNFDWKHPERIITPTMRSEVERIQKKMHDQVVDKALIDAEELHEYLSDAIRADWADIENDDGTFKPMSQWPLIWRLMKERGDVEIEEESVRSHDGEDTEGRGGWESSGKVVRKVKIAFASKVKLLELAMKHKGVDAMASQKSEVDVNVNIQAVRQREIANARRRVAKVVEVKPEE